MNFRGICISSTGGSGGKTILSLGLARAFKNRGFFVKPFKKGPDYIDATLLSLSAGIPATNLDPFFLKDERLQSLFYRSLYNAAEGYKLVNSDQTLAIVEGNRGLFDGLDDKGSCSTSHVARLLKLPIIICLDCTKITRTAAAILHGLINFEKDNIFAGVILNKIGSSRHENILRSAISSSINLPILGVLPRLSFNPLPERHMGLKSNGKMREEVDKILNELAIFIEKNCDINSILNLTSNIDCPHIGNDNFVDSPTKKNAITRPKIGVVEDEAFWFKYPENLTALANSGCDIVPLSMFDTRQANSEAWNEIHGLYICGGFPEDYVERLSFSPYLKYLYNYSLQGMPIYAECGGLILCCSSFTCGGKDWKMAGIFSGNAIWTNRPVGLGYVEGRIILPNPYFPQGLNILGHEFHYTKLVNANQDSAALLLNRGYGISHDQKCQNKDGLLLRNTWGSFFHIFAPSLPEWSDNFYKAAYLYSKGVRNISFSADSYVL